MTEATPFEHLPMLYERIRLLDRRNDRDLRLLPVRNFGFAATAAALPVVAEEFFTAQAVFPLMFSGKQHPRPAALAA